MNDDKFLCKQCGNPLEWEDTYDVSGGLLDGHLLERQLWTCPHCQKDYVIEQECELCKPQVVYFEEA